MADVILTADVVLNPASVRNLGTGLNTALGKSNTLKLNDQFSPALGRITHNLGQFNRSLDAATARVLAFGATASIIFGVERALSGTLKSMISVEKAITDIGITMSAAGQTLERFKNSLFDISKNTGQPFKIAAEAALELSRQGLGVEETLKRTTAALILTRRTGMDAASSVDALTAAINSFSDSMLDANQLVNKMVAVDQSFAVSSKDLAEAIKRVGSSAQDAGVGIDQLIALVTAAQQTTARGGAVIGNSLKTIFTRLERTTVIDQLEQLGIAVKDTGRNLLPAQQILQNLASSYDKLGQSQRAQVAELVGGVFQINVLKATLGDLSKQFSIYDSALKISSRATNEAVVANEQLNQTLSALVNKTLVNLTQAGAKIGGGAVSPVFKQLAGWVNWALEKTVNSEETQGIGQALGKGIIDGLGKFLTGPGLIMIGGIATKLFLNFAKDAKQAVFSLFEINDSLQIQSTLYANILNELKAQPQLLAQIQSGEKTINQIALERLKIIESEIALRKVASQIAISSTAAITSAGYGLVRLPQMMGSEKAIGIKPRFSKIPSTLSNALAAEASARPISSIRISSHPSLTSSFNPAGIGVYNTVDEPMGLSQGISRAISEGKNPKTYGIPNFAPRLEQNPQGMFGVRPLDIDQKISRAYEKLLKQVEVGEVSLKEINNAAKNLGKKFDLTSQSVASVRTTLINVAKKSDSFQYGVNQLSYKPSISNIYNPPTGGTLPSMGNVVGYPKPEAILGPKQISMDAYRTSVLTVKSQIENQRDILLKQTFSELERKASGFFGRGARRELQGFASNIFLSETERDRANVALTGARNTFQNRALNASLITTIAAPIIAETLSQTTNNRVGKAAISAGGDIASYAALGFSFAGPAGALGGAGIGAALGASKIYTEATTKLPELQKLSDRLTNSFGKLTENFQELTNVTERLGKIARREISSNEIEQRDLISRQQRIVSQIESPQIRQSIEGAISSGNLQDLGDIIQKAVIIESSRMKLGQSALSQQQILENIRPSRLIPILKGIGVGGVTSGIVGARQFPIEDILQTYSGAGLTREGLLKPEVRETGKRYGFSLFDVPVTSTDKNVTNLGQLLAKNPQLLRKITAESRAGSVSGVKSALQGINFDLSRQDLEDSLGPLFEIIGNIGSGKGGKTQVAATQQLETIFNTLGLTALRERRDLPRILQSQDDQRQLNILLQQALQSRSLRGFRQTLGGISQNELQLQRLGEGFETQRMERGMGLEIRRPFLSERELRIREYENQVSDKLNELTLKLSNTSGEVGNKIAKTLDDASDVIGKNFIKSAENLDKDQKEYVQIASGLISGALSNYKKQILEKALNPEELLGTLNSQIQELQTKIEAENRRAGDLKLPKLIQETSAIQSQVLTEQLKTYETAKNDLETLISVSKSQKEQLQRNKQANEAIARELEQQKNRLGLFGGIGGIGTYSREKQGLELSALYETDSLGVESTRQLLDFINQTKQKPSPQLLDKFVQSSLVEYLRQGVSEDDASRMIFEGLQERYPGFKENRPTFQFSTGRIPTSIFERRNIDTSNAPQFLETLMRLQTGGGANPVILRQLAEQTKGLGYRIPESLRNQIIEAEVAGGKPRDAAKAQALRDFPIAEKAGDILDLRTKQKEVEELILELNKQQFLYLKEMDHFSANINFNLARDRFMRGEISGEQFKTILDAKNQADIQGGKTPNFGRTLLSEFAYNSQDLLKDLNNTAKDLGRSLKEGFKDAFGELLRGTKSAKEAFRDMGIELLQRVQKNISDIAINTAFSYLGKAFGQNNSGIGNIANLFKAGGGMVVGGSGVKDDVPAVLTGGEYVINKNSVNKYGIGYLSALNVGAIPRFADGGITVGLDNKYLYNNRYKPSAGTSLISPDLSNFALSDENNPMNALRMSRESELLEYLLEKSSYESQNRAAIKRFRNKQFESSMYSIASSLVAAAGSYGGRKLTGINTGSVRGIRDLPSTNSLMFSTISRTAAGGGYFGDSTPALLMGGEMVMNRQATNKYGVGFFNRLNSGTVPRFADGGLVAGGAPIYSVGNDSFSEGLSELISINTEIKEAITGENGNTRTNIKAGETSSIVNNVSITINSAGNGENQTTAQTQSDTNSTKSKDIENNKKLAETIQQVVLNTIVKQQRNGGLLERARPS